MRLSLGKCSFSHLSPIHPVELKWIFFFFCSYLDNFFFVVRSAIASFRGSNSLDIQHLLPPPHHAPDNAVSFETSPVRSKTRGTYLHSITVGYHVFATAMCNRDRTGRRWATYLYPPKCRRRRHPFSPVLSRNGNGVCARTHRRRRYVVLPARRDHVTDVIYRSTLIGDPGRAPWPASISTE